MRQESELVKRLDEHTIEVSLPNKLGYERIAMECSASFAKIVGFVPERIDDLKTAVSEACLNAIEHGNKGRHEARVIVTMNFEDNTFSVCVQDQGSGIKGPLKEPDIVKKVRMLEPPKGYGIYLIKKLMDHVEFSRMTRGGHFVRMSIKLTHE